MIEFFQYSLIRENTHPRNVRQHLIIPLKSIYCRQSLFRDPSSFAYPRRGVNRFMPGMANATAPASFHQSHDRRILPYQRIFTRSEYESAQGRVRIHGNALATISSCHDASGTVAGRFEIGQTAALTAGEAAIPANKK